MEIISFFATFLLVVITYGAGYMALYKKRCSRNSAVMGFVLYLLLGGAYYFFEFSISHIIYFMICMVPILLIVYRIFLFKDIWGFVKSCFFIEITEEAIESVIEYLLYRIAGIDLTTNSDFFLSVFFVLVLCLIGMYFDFRTILYQRNKINKLLAVGLVGLLMALIITISLLEYAQQYVNNERFYLLSTGSVAFSYLGILVLGLFILYTRKINIEYKFSLDIEIELRMLQKDSYERMLEKEVETRRFRHDYLNHMICLNAMLEKNEMDKLKKYIEQMQLELKKIQKKNYSTGNIIIDAIFNYYLLDIQENVEIHVEGVCPKNIGVNDYDLSSIVSNAITNAIEGVERQKSDCKCKKISIKMFFDDKNFSMRIWNTCDRNALLNENDFLKTVKKEKNKHGFGLINMRKLVERNFGEIYIEEDQGRFTLLFTLPYILNRTK